MRGETTRTLFEGALDFFLHESGNFTPLTPLPPLRKGEGE
jgi:hypothetical protein